LRRERLEPPDAPPRLAHVVAEADAPLGPGFLAARGEHGQTPIVAGQTRKQHAHLPVRHAPSTSSWHTCVRSAPTIVDASLRAIIGDVGQDPVKTEVKVWLRWGDPYTAWHQGQTSGQNHRLTPR